MVDKIPGRAPDEHTGVQTQQEHAKGRLRLATGDKGFHPQSQHGNAARYNKYFKNNALIGNNNGPGMAALLWKAALPQLSKPSLPETFSCLPRNGRTRFACPVTAGWQAPVGAQAPAPHARVREVWKQHKSFIHTIYFFTTITCAL
ncbi:hypothetical protein HNW77_07515 [Komagataeibacter sp. AV436]|uniref:Uncharacterized protein n=1 Tax=Komagataeibacter melomenusus TaxID=2766578 RepID=A0ABX2ADF9_9PROT|nr:hypothetical protein [Komagataeibacter melomenusus]MBV1830991.1 hypothetical protein [Komagataeibacter melomenusus]NPC66235.1 hypothetical protein [Komagataeibacter melomenusus]